MATTVSYSASMRTRKSNSSSNYKASAASQEYYDPGTNFVGIVCFSGMSLANKVITNLSLKVTSAMAGYGAGTTKTVYVRRSLYQAPSQSGINGGDYYGTALGTFSGSFYSNTTTNVLTGTLFDNLAAYIAGGNNTICLFNPSPQSSSQGYSKNYLQWESATLTVTYEEASSQPTMSAATVAMGSSVTIFTNRQSLAATHTLRYSFFTSNGIIDSNVADVVSWTPPLSLAAQIPSATSGWGTLLCDTYVNGSLISTKTCLFTLTVPASVTPGISSLTYFEATSGIAAQFSGFVRSRSTLSVSLSAAGSQGSTITAYRTTLNGTVYTASSFTTGVLNTAGGNTLSVTVTDSRGRTATETRTFTVLDYSPPSLTRFNAERCNSTGTSAQMDGNRVRITAAATAAPVGNKNTMICTVYYKTSSASAWTQATTITPSNYNIAATNLLLPQTFDVLSSFDLQIRVQDYFYSIEQTISVGTKQVMMDFFRGGAGIAFGKVAENAGKVELGWPVVLAEPLEVEYGGTGADNAATACIRLGAVRKAGDLMTGNLEISGYLYPSINLLPNYNNTTNRTVFEGSYIGASSFAAWEDAVGNNRRMLEVRTAKLEASMDNAVVVRSVINGVFYAYRVFHAGMGTPIPVSNGGTGANYAKAALNNLGIFYSSSLPISGIDGQICLVPV